MSDDLFGLDDPGDAWLERAAQARAAPRLGFLGRFELLEEVGRGGQGIVYRAREIGSDAIVAVKRLVTRGAGDDERRRLERELVAVQAVRHPNVVKARGLEDVDGEPVLVMDWIEGRPIDVWASPASPSQPSLDRRLDLMLALCDAVHEAHQKGVIHRDLKPSNVLVDATDQPFVLDFGLAKVLAIVDSLSSSGQFLGSLPWAAPEQLDGQPGDADVRSDVYALGVLLYELLAGARPFAGAKLGALVEAIRAGGVTRPSALADGLDRELDAIVAQAMAVTPEARYQSVEALAADLRRYRRGEPITALDPRGLYLLRKSLRRHWRTVAALALVALATIAFAVRESAAARDLARARDTSVAAEARRLRAWNTAWRIIRFLQVVQTPTGAQTDPDDVTLTQILAEAERRVADGELADAPEARGEVLLVLGRIQLAIGRPERARATLLAACESLRAAPERSEQHLVHGIIDLARATIATDPTAAIALHREALARALTLDPPVPQCEILARFDLALALDRTGAGTAAREEAGRAWERARRELGDDDRLTARARDWLDRQAGARDD